MALPSQLQDSQSHYNIQLKVFMPFKDLKIYIVFFFAFGKFCVCGVCLCICLISTFNFIVTYFFFDLGDVDWNTLLAVIRFSMYWPRTWFSDLSLRFSSFTVSTLEDKSIKKIKLSS